MLVEATVCCYESEAEVVQTTMLMQSAYTSTIEQLTKYVIAESDCNIQA